MKCPHCGNEINAAAMLGSVTSKKKSRAARLNGKLGGWPKGRKRGKRPPRDPNRAALGVIAAVEEITRHSQAPVVPECQ